MLLPSRVFGAAELAPAALCGTVLFSIGLTIYWPALSGGFVFDDAQFTAPGVLRGMLDPRTALETPRPLLMLTYALNYRWSGLNPLGFHLFNVLLHCFNAFLLWRILTALAVRCSLDSPMRPAPRLLIVFGTPLLFLCSPIQTEAVAYISSRSELLAASFYLLAILAFVSGWRERRRCLAAAVIGLLYVSALASKQHAVSLPATLLVIDWLVLPRQRPLAESAVPVYAVLFAVMLAGAVVVGKVLLTSPTAGFSLENVPWTDYLFTQMRVWFLYLRLLAVPVGLNLDHDIEASHSLFDHFSWLALLGLTALIGAAFHLRRHAPLASVGVLFFAITLAPGSSFFPLSDFAAEHRLYLPSIGFFLSATGLIAAIWNRASYALIWILIGTTCGAYAAATWQRSRLWSDGLALWQDAARKSPLKYRTHNNVGVECLRRQRYQEASEAFLRAEQLVLPNSPHHAHVVNNLGLSYANQGLHASASDCYEKALRIADVPLFRANLAISQIRLGSLTEGWANFERALQASGGAVSIRLARAEEYSRAGRYTEAATDYEHVVAACPDCVSASRQLALNRQRASHPE